MMAVAPAQQQPDAVLSFDNLTITAGQKVLLDGVSFAVRPGERLGIIGESGSGKSLTVTSAMGLLPDTLVAAGGIFLDRQGLDGKTENLLHMSDRKLCRIRGRDMAMVFQEPMTALNPLMQVGKQVAEMVLEHASISAAEAERRAVSALAEVKLPDPEHMAHRFPFQLSGGQRQRVMLAMAMINSPKILFADEPTTALDVMVQSEVLTLMGNLTQEHNTALVFISHDLAVVSSLCDRVLVMRHGKIIETGTTQQILTHPQAEYTQQLLAASDLSHRDVRAAASQLDHESAVAPANHVLRVGPDDDVVVNEQPSALALYRVRHVAREYGGGRGLFGGRRNLVQGLRGVSFDIVPGQRFGLVGESGSGKSTLLRILSALDAPTRGEVIFRGQHIDATRESELKSFRKRVQLVFQDPMSSLNPRMNILQIVAEPLRGVSKPEKVERVAQLLDAVGLDAQAMYRAPHQFSGGQRQRIAIARALITRPDVVIADEAVSALDVSVRAQVLNLLSQLADEFGLTLIFVSHDMGVIRHICDVVAVLRDGEFVEGGSVNDVYENPLHEYTQQLVAATPDLARNLERLHS